MNNDNKGIRNIPLMKEMLRDRVTTIMPHEMYCNSSGSLIL